MPSTGSSRRPNQPDRPNIRGTRHAVVAGHYLAAHAGFQVLEAGGNAVDAGVAGGLALGVVESEYVNVAGVAPILIYLAATGEVVTIAGLGTWPKAASSTFFQTRHGGDIPIGILRTVVPAAPDAWITALEKYGTMSFADVAAAAIRFAGEGFPMYPLMHDIIEAEAATVRGWPSSAAVFLPDGRPPEVGKLFVQSDLARTLQYMADEEAAAKGGREAGLAAARDAFYKGDIAAQIIRFHEENGGLLTAEDLAGYRVTIEPPVHTRFADIDVYGCGPWCQGPMLLQALGVLNGIDLENLGHNTTAYVHTVTEAIKLAAADREAYYGDPKFVDVPIQKLLSPEYAASRRALIRPHEAWPDMPPAGEVGGGGRARPGAPAAPTTEPRVELDTSYVCVVDSQGNAFSATPSDGSLTAPVVPGTGIMPSTRGYQSWTDPNHPSSVAPGKRPRLTPNPALAMRRGSMVMPFGSPGHDVQTQVMLQAFLNIFVFGMDPQTAVEAPRFASYSFPSSALPHESHPGRLNLEGLIAADVGDGLAALGHRLEWWPERDWLAGSVCAILADTETGILHAAADPRRTAYAIGW